MTKADPCMFKFVAFVVKASGVLFDEEMEMLEMSLIKSWHAMRKLPVGDMMISSGIGDVELYEKMVFDIAENVMLG